MWALLGGSPLKGDLLICRFASRSIEWVVALIDGLRGLRWFRSLRTIPALRGSIENLHLVGHDFDCCALLASTVFPFPSLQSAFDVDVSTTVKVLTANLGQAGEADDLKPLHPFPGSAFCVFPPLVDRKAERTDGLALRAEFKFRRPTQKPDQNYFVHTLAVTGTIKWPAWPLYASNLSFRGEISPKCRSEGFSWEGGKILEDRMIYRPKILPAVSGVLLPLS